MKKITWKTEKRLLNSLKDHPKNPRKISQKSHDELLKSFEEFDYAELIAINIDGTILAGHQRAHVMIELGWHNKEVEVRVPCRELNQKEAKKYMLRSNKNTGEWDLEILYNEFEKDDLLEAGFEESELFSNDDTIEDEEPQDKEFDESITDGLSVIVRFVISIPNEDSTSLENQLSELLKKFERAKLEKKI